MGARSLRGGIAARRACATFPEASAKHRVRHFVRPDCSSGQEEPFRTAGLCIPLAGRLTPLRDDGGGKSMNGAALQERLLDTLLGRIKEEKYPSVTMMNRVEGSLRTREQVEGYAEVLLEKIEATRYPSSSMLDRFDGLVATLES